MQSNTNLMRALYNRSRKLYEFYSFVNESYTTPKQSSTTRIRILHNRTRIVYSHIRAVYESYTNPKRIAHGSNTNPMQAFANPMQWFTNSMQKLYAIVYETDTKLIQASANRARTLYDPYTTRKRIIYIRRRMVHESYTIVYDS